MTKGLRAPGAVDCIEAINLARAEAAGAPEPREVSVEATRIGDEDHQGVRFLTTNTFGDRLASQAISSTNYVRRGPIVWEYLISAPPGGASLFADPDDVAEDIATAVEELARRVG